MPGKKWQFAGTGCPVGLTERGKISCYNGFCLIPVAALERIASTLRNFEALWVDSADHWGRSAPEELPASPIPDSPNQHRSRPSQSAHAGTVGRRTYGEAKTTRQRQGMKHFDL